MSCRPTQPILRRNPRASDYTTFHGDPPKGTWPSIALRPILPNDDHEGGEDQCSEPHVNSPFADYLAMVCDRP